MRFLFLGGGSYVGGMERVLFTLMRSLRDRGHAVEAIVAGWNDGEHLSLLQSAGLRGTPIKLGRPTRHVRHLLHGLRHYPRAALQLLREVRKFCPDVVVHVDVLTAFSAMPCLPRQALHVLHVHNVPGHDYRLALGRLALRRMDGFICVSHFIECKLGELVDKRLILVAHNGVEPATHARAPASSGSKCIRFGIVGQIQSRKRHSVLLRALESLNEAERAQCELLIIGRQNGAETGQLRELIAELSLGDKVRWTGHLREKDSIYGGLDVLVAPSVDEPFGLTVLEAANYAIPSIAARSGGFPETIVDGITGILVEPDSAVHLAAAMRRFIENPSLKCELGDRAKRHVAQHFTPASGGRFETCILELAQARNCRH